MKWNTNCVGGGGANKQQPKKYWGGCVETVTILTKVMELNFQQSWFQSI